MTLSFQMGDDLLTFLARFHGLGLAFSSVAFFRRSYDLQSTARRYFVIVGRVLQRVVDAVHLRAAEPVAMAAGAGLHVCVHLGLVHGSGGGLIVLSAGCAQSGHAGGQGRKFFVVTFFGGFETCFGVRGGVAIVGLLGCVELTLGCHSFGRF